MRLTCNSWNKSVYFWSVEGSTVYLTL